MESGQSLDWFWDTFGVPADAATSRLFRFVCLLAVETAISIAWFKHAIAQFVAANFIYYFINH